MANDIVVKVRGLEKTYGASWRRPGFRALDGVDLEVRRGSIFGLLGPNGAGKTTLVKILLGLVHRTGGEAELLGEPVGRERVRQRVGYLPEAHRLPGYLTGRSMLRLSGAMVGRKRAWVDERTDPWLERLGMAASAERKIREYSKGMMQRVGLVQALLHEPEVVFLDEPTDGVDPVGRRSIREVCTELAEGGTTIFINSHLLMEVEMICDRIVILKDGRILEEGSLEELTSSQDEVKLRLAGHPGRERLLASLPPQLSKELTLDEASPDHSLLSLVADDEQLNRIIDGLRGAGVLIQGIDRGRSTLEETFIQLVTEADA